MIEVSEILYRYNLGMTKRGITQSLSISRNTLKQIIKEAEGLGLKQGVSTNEEIDRVSSQIIEVRQKKGKVGEVQERLASWHEQMVVWRKDPNMTSIQMLRLLAEKGEIFSETSLRRYVRRNFPEMPKSTVHLDTIPGKQAQVDYGYVGMMIDPRSNKLRRTYAFIMTMSHSRHRFVRFVFRQNVESWIDCHIRAFNFFGGVPETVLLDNLKSGVIKPHIYDPTLNRSYVELERHYGFIADPAKVRKPEHKGKVERSVTVVKQQVVAGRNHKDIQAANEYALNWCRHEIGERVTRTTGETPWNRFVRDEKAILRPLPLDEFEMPIWQSGIVHKDHHVVFDGSFYSVPTKYITKEVWVRATFRMVEIYLDETLIKTHVRATQKAEWITDPQDYPSYAREFLENTPAACLGIARSLGGCIYKVVSEVLKRKSITNQRKAQGILRLAEQYGMQRLEAACDRALRFDNLKYDSIKRILDLRLDKEILPPAIAVAPTAGAYLRGADEFAVVNAGGWL